MWGLRFAGARASGKRGTHLACRASRRSCAQSQCLRALPRQRCASRAPSSRSCAPPSLAGARRAASPSTESCPTSRAAASAPPHPGPRLLKDRETGARASRSLALSLSLSLSRERERERESPGCVGLFKRLRARRVRRKVVLRVVATPPPSLSRPELGIDTRLLHVFESERRVVDRSTGGAKPTPPRDFAKLNVTTRLGRQLRRRDDGLTSSPIVC